MTEEEVLFARRVLQRNWLKRDVVNACLAERKSRAGRERGVPLWDLCIEKNLLTPNQVRELQRRQGDTPPAQPVARAATPAAANAERILVAGTFGEEDLPPESAVRELQEKAAAAGDEAALAPARASRPRSGPSQAAWVAAILFFLATLGVLAWVYLGAR